MKGILVSASLGVLTLGFNALSSADTLRGEVYYLPRIALPATAKVTVKLVDAAKADAPSEVIASKEFSTEGRQVPIPFELDYEPSRLKATGRYQVQAQIWDGNQLRFTTTTAIPFTGGTGFAAVQGRDRVCYVFCNGTGRYETGELPGHSEGELEPLSRDKDLRWICRGEHLRRFVY